MSHSVHPLEDLGNVPAIELAHDEEIAVLALGSLLCDADPFMGEHPAEVRHGIQSEAIDANLAHHPIAPFLDVFSDFGVGVVDVGKHEIVSVAHAVVHVGSPVLLAPVGVHGGTRARKCLWCIDNLVDGVLLGALVPVGAVEMLPVPLQAAVAVSATREVVVDPGFDLLGGACLDSVVCNVSISPCFACGSSTHAYLHDRPQRPSTPLWRLPQSCGSEQRPR